MSKSNTEVCREFIEQVVNAKQLDLLDEFFSPDFVYHTPPFVGMGIITDDSSGERMVVREVVPGSPADGRLQVGDEIVAAADATNTWTSFMQLKHTDFGRGKLGSQVTLTVHRGENMIEVLITRGQVPGGPVPRSIGEEGYRRFLTTDYPDFKAEINLLIGEGDLVAYYLTDSGTSADFGQAAVWMESGFMRFKDGKITDWWSVSDDFNLMKQLGYQVKAPEALGVRN